MRTIHSFWGSTPLPGSARRASPALCHASGIGDWVPTPPAAEAKRQCAQSQGEWQQSSQFWRWQRRRTGYVDREIQSSQSRTGAVEQIEKVIHIELRRAGDDLDGEEIHIRQGSIGRDRHVRRDGAVMNATVCARYAPLHKPLCLTANVVLD